MPRAALVFVLLCVLSLAVYAPSFDNGFRDDDFVYLDHAVHAHGLGKILNPGAAFAFYRPGAWLLFSLEHRAFGAHAGRYLAFNWVLHLVNSLLLLFLLRRMHVAPDAAAWAAGLFVVGFGHYGKQVMWACTSGPLMAVALVLTVMLLARAALDARDRTTSTALALAAGVAAFLAPAFHESALVAPVVVFVMWLAARRGDGKDGVASIAPFVGTAVAAAAWLAVIATMASSQVTYAHWARTLGRAPWYLVRYVGLMALPLQQPLNTPRVAWAPLGAFVPIVQLVVGSMVGVAAWGLARTAGTPTTRARVTTLAAWGLIALAPFSLIAMPAGWLELRYVYFASAAFNALAALWLARRSPRTRATFLALILLMTVTVTLLLEHKYDAMAASSPRVAATVRSTR